MLSAIIPTLDSGPALPATLRALVGVDELVVVDGGSRDETVAVAKAAGAHVIATSAGRGHQLATGAEAAKGPWLLFVHADTVLASHWPEVVAAFIGNRHSREQAAAFRFILDDPSPQARRLERWVAWRVRRFGLPYGDQGLLIHRDLYRAVGGFRPLPIMEDVDLIRRIGRHRLVLLDADACTSAVRWQREGWRRRSARNLGCLSLYFLGMPPRVLKRLYG